MALTVIATPSADNANSYATVAEANAYFEGRLNVDAWTNASSTDKDKALVMATTRLEQETYKGYLTTTTQKLKWPRIWVLREGDEYGMYWDSAVIPPPMKEALFELALVLLRDGTTDTLADTGMEGFASVQLGPIAVTKDDRFKGGQLPANVKRLLLGFSDSVAQTVRLLRS